MNSRKFEGKTDIKALLHSKRKRMVPGYTSFMKIKYALFYEKPLYNKPGIRRPNIKKLEGGNGLT